jgi:flagellin
MGFSINTNLDALNTYRNLTTTQNSLSSSLAKLSSGLRINNAGDDAAGLTIATGLGAQISGLQQASRNAQDGVSVVQTADGALGQAQSLLGRLRDLAVQAANDSNSASARTAIKTEATSVTAELQRLGQSTNFNGKALLDGSAGTMKFQVGADGNAQSQISVSLSSANLTAVATALSTGSVSTATSYAVSNLTDANSKSLTFVDTSGSTTTTVSVAIGASGAANDGDYAGFVSKLNSDAGFSAKFTASVTKDANGNSNGFAVTANDGGAASMSNVATVFAAGGHTGVETQGTATTGISFDTADHAQLAIGVIQAQLDNVSKARSDIGALENRFASAVANIATSVTNLTAAKSRITDVDMASEMVNYSRANILAQSGTAMLAQANQAPQLALKLLG